MRCALADQRAAHKQSQQSTNKKMVIGKQRHEARGPSSGVAVPHRTRKQNTGRLCQRLLVERRGVMCFMPSLDRGDPFPKYGEKGLPRTSSTKKTTGRKLFEGRQAHSCPSVRHASCSTVSATIYYAMMASRRRRKRLVPSRRC